MAAMVVADFELLLLLLFESAVHGLRGLAAAAETAAMPSYS